MSIKHTWQVSNIKMTVLVKTTNGIIHEAAPIVRVFVGQPLDNLAAWMRKLGTTTVTQLDTNAVLEH